METLKQHNHFRRSRSERGVRIWDRLFGRGSGVLRVMVIDTRRAKVIKLRYFGGM